MSAASVQLCAFGALLAGQLRFAERLSGRERWGDHGAGSGGGTGRGGRAPNDEKGKESSSRRRKAKELNS